MTGHFFLDWASLATSLFNTILLVWLSLTIFLNAERRTWGIWLATAGLGLGAVFFISHTAILGHGLSPVTIGLNFWWQVGWIPVATLPFTWYIVMLWYAGFWESRRIRTVRKGGLYARQAIWLFLTSLLGAILSAYLLFDSPLPSLSQLVRSDQFPDLSIVDLPFSILSYPIYILVCVGLSVDALLHPEPSGRLMGDLARARARRWLIAASLGLLLVSVLVGWVMVWIVMNIGRGILFPGVITTIGWFDLAIESWIALSILSLGQAVVAYEVFTGKTLPRRGLSQYWRRVVILAVGFSVLMAWSLVIELRPIYSLILSALLVVVFYALLGWRSYFERERMINNLRPFVSSQRLYENIMGNEEKPGSQDSGQVEEAFHTLCAELLETRQACLQALGPFVSLSGPPLIFPKGARLSLPPISEIISRIEKVEALGSLLDPHHHGGMVFAVPLWSGQGLSGVLLLGEKQTYSPYTQEEIEIARATGERLIDSQVSGEMARRLIALQRQRLINSQVVDRRARHVLHDDVLPLVHAALINLNNTQKMEQETNSQTAEILIEVHHLLSNLLNAMPAATAAAVERLGLVGALHETVDEEMRSLFDQVNWTIQSGIEQGINDLPALVAEVVFLAAREAIRNAAQHGRGHEGEFPLTLSISVASRDNLNISIQDNGKGFLVGEREEATPRLAGGKEVSSKDSEPINGWCGQTYKGSGQGLALHSTMMAVIGGTLTVDSLPGQYTRVILDLPKESWQQ